MSAPFRISRKRFDDIANTQDEAVKEYLGRLIKMIPSEVIGLYLAGIGVISANDDGTLQLIWVAVCLVGVIAVRWYGTSDAEKGLKPQWPVIFISSVSFVIWIYSMGGPFVSLGLFRPVLGTLFVSAWSFFVPLIYKGPIEA
jgi:hypothetical protein